MKVQLNFRYWWIALLLAMGLIWAKLFGRTINEMALPTTTSTGSRLIQPISDDKWPIVYSSSYDISFMGLQKLHPFDTCKWGNIFTHLQERMKLSADDVVAPPSEITHEELTLVHTEEYLKSLERSADVARIVEVPVNLVPNGLLQTYLLKPLRFQTAGTVMAANYALSRGWAINIGGGFHHCSAGSGGGFCVYADITLAIKYLFKYQSEHVQKAMIIDLDAHQGNGHERDFTGDPRVYILDVYNKNIYPHDSEAKRGISKAVELSSYTEDAEYLRLVKKNVKDALDEFQPHIVVYNAGTDILENDPLGHTSITSYGIIERDEIVFSLVRAKQIPIVMVTSGGYQKHTALIIANSVINLWEKGLIVHKPRPEPKESEL